MAAPITVNKRERMYATAPRRKARPQGSDAGGIAMEKREEVVFIEAL
jgi:hypothetical protein